MIIALTESSSVCFPSIEVELSCSPGQASISSCRWLDGTVRCYMRPIESITANCKIGKEEDIKAEVLHLLIAP